MNPTAQKLYDMLHNEKSPRTRLNIARKLIQLARLGQADSDAIVLFYHRAFPRTRQATLDEARRAGRLGIFPGKPKATELASARDQLVKYFQSEADSIEKELEKAKPPEKVKASPTKPVAQKLAGQRRKLPWLGRPAQLGEFFRFVFDPGAHQETAEYYFYAKGSRENIIPDSAPRLRTRLPTNQLRYAFYVAQEEMGWLQLQKSNAELAQFCMAHNGRELNAKRLGKNKVTTDLSKRHQQEIYAKLLEIKALGI